MITTQKLKKFVILAVFSLITLFIVLKISEGIVSGKLKYVYMPIGLAVLITLPHFVNTIGAFPLFLWLIFLFWAPFSTGLGNLSPILDIMWTAEFGMWVMFVAILIHGSASKNKRFYHAVKNFPNIPFLLIITGFVIANVTSENFFRGSEIANFRVISILPFITLFLCIYFIGSIYNAERAAWYFLISSGIFVSVYLFAPNVHPDPMEILANEGSMRLYKLVKLPLCSKIYVTPANGAICISLVLAVAYVFFILTKVVYKKLLALLIVGMCIAAIILSQGRSAIIGSICAVIVIQYLHIIFYKKNKLSFSNFFKPILIAFIILGSVYFTASTATDIRYRDHGLQLFKGPTKLILQSGRCYRWTEAAKVIVEKPFGVGISGFPGTESSLSWIAHNLYLFLWLSFGFLGLIGFMLIISHLIKLFYYGLHSFNQDKIKFSIIGIGCIVILIVSGMSSPIFWSPWEVLIFWFPISISAAAVSIPVSSPKNV
jgi:hypothetical protein